MRNIAKCKLCQCVIESYHQNDYVMCKCGEIALDGGEALRCFAKSFDNFLRVDDNGNEIQVKVKEEEIIPESDNKPNKSELLAMLDEMASSYEKMPPNALSQSVTYYDLWSTLLLISQILKCKDKDEKVCDPT